MISSFNLSFQLWLKLNCSVDITSHTLTPWKVIFPAACWVIWKARNAIVYANASFQPRVVAKQAISMALEFVTLNTSFKTNNAVTTLIGWSPPLNGFFKLNTDGAAAKNPGSAGAGGVIRNSAGNFVKGFSRNIGFASSFAAELWGLRDGLQLAVDLNIKNLIIEIDARAVINSITKPMTDLFSQHISLIHDCRALLQLLESFQLKHTYREGNKVADILAKEGIMQQNTFVLFDSPPPSIVTQLDADFVGSKYPRLICM